MTLFKKIFLNNALCSYFPSKLASYINAYVYNVSNAHTCLPTREGKGDLFLPLLYQHLKRAGFFFTYKDLSSFTYFPL